ncbi:MAG: site-2 protease family protein, partial [Chloroflexota bacterium]|nr:site-2 protease family protein [Chloroflexota bacterium]
MIVALSIVFVLFMVISIHELGHFLAGRAAGVPIAEFGIGFPPRLFAIKRGETEYSLNLIIFGAFVRFVGEDITSSSLGNRGIGTRFLVAGAGPVANFLLAILLFTVAFMLPVPVATGGDGVRIITVAAGSPAEQAGIQRGDILLRIERQAVPAPEAVRTMVTPRRGIPTTLLLQRGSSELEVTVTPQVNPPPGRGAIGIELGWANPRFTTRPGLSLGEAGLQSLNIIVSLPITLANFFGGLVSQPGDNLMGPVGAAQLAGEVARVGLAPLLATAAGISL